MWSRGNRSRSSSITARPCRARRVAAVEPAGPPPTTTTSGRSPSGLDDGSAGFGSSFLLVAGSMSKGPGRSSSLAISRHGGDHLLAHEPQRAHRVLVVHGAVAVPEEDRARAQRLQHVRILGITVFGVPVMMVILSIWLLVGRRCTSAGLERAVRRSTCGPCRAPRRRRLLTVGSSWVRDVMPGRFCMKVRDVALAALQERVAGPSTYLRAGLLGQLLGLVDVDLEQVAEVLGAGLVAVLLAHCVVVVERLPSSAPAGSRA